MRLRATRPAGVRQRGECGRARLARHAAPERHLDLLQGAHLGRHEEHEGLALADAAHPVRRLVRARVRARV